METWTCPSTDEASEPCSHLFGSPPCRLLCFFGCCCGFLGLQRSNLLFALHDTKTELDFKVASGWLRNQENLVLQQPQTAIRHVKHSDLVSVTGQRSMGSYQFSWSSAFPLRLGCLKKRFEVRHAASDSKLPQLLQNSFRSLSGLQCPSNLPDMSLLSAVHELNVSCKRIDL